MTPLEAELIRRQIGSTYGPTATLGNVGDYFFKKGGAGPMQKAIGKDTASLVKMIPGVSSRNAVKVGQFAGRAAPLLSAVGNVADVADLVTSDDGLDNKLVDAAGMGIGGTLGFVFGGGPLGASVGASLGKAVTDGVQGMFFGGTEKEKKLAEALAMLEGGRI
jgi:hypothetical protein